MRYKQYKAIEIPWVSSVPASWTMVPNKVLFRKHQNKVGEAFKDFQLLSLTTNGIKQKSLFDIKGKVPTSYTGYQEVNENDMVFCLFDLDVSAVFSGISPYHGMITSAYDVAKCNESYIIPHYADYWFRFVFSNRYYKMYSKNVRYTLSYDAFGSLKTPIPTINEQKKIVKYLDWQVSKINKLISSKKKEIDLLKERQKTFISNIVLSGTNPGAKKEDSGISWIGDIPSHWKTYRCKYLFSERDERSIEGKEQHLSMSQKYGLVPDTILDERRMLSESYARGKICYENDLVLNRLKAHLGVFSLAPQMGVISPDYTVLIPRIERIIPAYAEAVLKSQKCRRELRVRVKGVTEGFWRLYTDSFNTIVLPVPPVEEQKSIMDEIKLFEEKTANYISVILKEVEVLHELRNKLISDVVTGQIDVRDIEVPEFEFVDEIEDESDKDTDEENDNVDEEE